MSEPQHDAAPRTVAVIGAGTMGPGIALCFSIAGSAAALTARRAETLDRARRQVDASLDLLVRHGRLDEAGAAGARGRIRYGQAIEWAVEDADLVVESVVEDLEVKRALLAQIGAAAPPAAVIASNTSSLPLEALAPCVPDPGRFAGLHWFNPPELVELVEVVSVEATRPCTALQLMDWAMAAG